MLDMTEKVSATPLNCSKTAEIFRTNEALNLMTANPNTNTAAREVIETCRAALAEELAGWDIEPPSSKTVNRRGSDGR